MAKTTPTTIEPGQYSIEDVLSVANFDFHKEAAADYLDGEADHRRVTVGGLPFGSLQDEVFIPQHAETVEVVLDGKVVATLKVDNGVRPE
jgi:hypothetical protein